MTSPAALFAVMCRETPDPGPQVGDRVEVEKMPYSGKLLPGTVTRALGRSYAGFIVVVHFDGDSAGVEFVRTVKENHEN